MSGGRGGLRVREGYLVLAPQAVVMHVYSLLRVAGEPVETSPQGVLWSGLIFKWMLAALSKRDCRTRRGGSGRPGHHYAATLRKCWWLKPARCLCRK